MRALIPRFCHLLLCSKNGRRRCIRIFLMSRYKRPLPRLNARNEHGSLLQWSSPCSSTLAAFGGSLRGCRHPIVSWWSRFGRTLMATLSALMVEWHSDLNHTMEELVRLPRAALGPLRIILRRQRWHFQQQPPTSFGHKQINYWFHVAETGEADPCIAVGRQISTLEHCLFRPMSWWWLWFGWKGQTMPWKDLEINGFRWVNRWTVYYGENKVQGNTLPSE